MTYVGKNIRKLRSVKKLSQTGFADLFGLNRNNIGSYEEGRADPKLDTIVAIAKYFGVSINDFITKELTINNIYHFDIFKDEYEGDRAADVTKYTRCIKEEQLEEYISNCKDVNYVKQLRSFDLPIDANRCFEISGQYYLCVYAESLEKATDKFVVAVHENGIDVGKYSIEAEYVKIDDVEILTSTLIETWKVEKVIGDPYLTPNQVKTMKSKFKELMNLFDQY